MTDNQLDDLKQLITTVTQQAVKQAMAEATKGINGKFDAVAQRFDSLEQKLSGQIDDLRQEMREGFAGVGDAFAPANDQLDNHEQRITTLEQQAA